MSSTTSWEVTNTGIDETCPRNRSKPWNHHESHKDQQKQAKEQQAQAHQSNLSWFIQGSPRPLSSAEHPSWAWTAAIGSPRQGLVSDIGKGCVEIYKWNKLEKSYDADWWKKIHMSWLQMRAKQTCWPSIRLSKGSSQAHLQGSHWSCFVLVLDLRCLLTPTWYGWWLDGSWSSNSRFQVSGLESMQPKFSLSRAFWYILKPWTWYSFSGSEPLYAAKPARATDTASLTGPSEPYSSACLHGSTGKTSHAFPATSTNIDTTTDSDHSIISMRNQRKFYSDRSLYPLHTPSTDQPWFPANCLFQGIHLLKQSFPLVINGPLHMDTGMLWVQSCLNWRAWPGGITKLPQKIQSDNPAYGDSQEIENVCTLIW